MAKGGKGGGYQAPTQVAAPAAIAAPAAVPVNKPSEALPVDERRRRARPTGAFGLGSLSQDTTSNTLLGQ